MKNIIKKLANNLKSKKLKSMANKIDRNMGDGILINIDELESVLGSKNLEPIRISDVVVDNK